MSGQTSPLSSLGIAADLELTKVVDIAGHVGDISEDDVNVSYTSLLIGLLWSDDPTSKWLQTQQTGAQKITNSRCCKALSSLFPPE